MSNFPPVLIEAVFLFKDGQIARQLLYQEFEAILDGFIPAPDFLNSSAKAVYLQINPALDITGAVFFLLEFDHAGMISRQWNVPLQQLLAVAGTGPDLGSGPIALVCYSQCPISWQQKHLWDPSLQEQPTTFALLQQSVKANHLGLVIPPGVFKSEVTTEASGTADENIHEREYKSIERRLHDHYAREMRAKLANWTEEHRLKVATLVNQHQTSVQEIQQAHHKRLTAYQQKIRELDQANEQLNQRNSQLKEQLEQQANKIEGIRDYFAHKLKAAQEDESCQIFALQENLALEMEIKIQAATAEMREMLDMREVELFYRHQSESALKDEIVHLKRENQALTKTQGEPLLERLAAAGICFVAFQPGIGQVSIALADLSRYLAQPKAYAAEQCGVSEALYEAWLEHQRLPHCKAQSQQAGRCGKSIAPISSPLEFHPGESDRCREHLTISYQLTAKHS